MDDEPSIKIGYRANARARSVNAEQAAKAKMSGGSVETNRKMVGNSSMGKASDGQKMGACPLPELHPPNTRHKG